MRNPSAACLSSPHPSMRLNTVMAQRVTVTVISDLSGEVVESETPTTRFGFDGTSYEIDLTEKERDELEAVLAPYIEKGRRAGGGKPRRRSSSSDSKARTPSTAEIRAWAEKQGMEVSERGRIPASVRTAYEAAHAA